MRTSPKYGRYHEISNTARTILDTLATVRPIIERAYRHKRQYPGAKSMTDTKRYKSGYVGQKSYGVLAGKVWPKRNARRYKRKGRRSAMRKVVKKLFKGVSYQTEVTGTVTGDKCVYIGHTTAYPEELLTMLVMVCIKNVLNEAGVAISSWEQPRLGYLTNGDVFQFVYKASPTSGPTAAFTNVTVVAGHISFYDVAAALAQAIITNMLANSLSDAAILTEFQYMPSGGKLVKIDLQDVLVNFFVKSALKIQNRSLAQPTDDEVDVNNVPVYGKLYNGTGNGALQRTVDSLRFVCGGNSTFPIAVDGSGFNNFAEPPDASEFTHVRKFGKVYLNPGQIKTAVLKFRSTINVSRLFQLINQYEINNATSQWFNLGAFNMFSLERVIAKLAAEATPGISITYEVDYKGYMSLKPCPERFTAPKRVVS